MFAAYKKALDKTIDSETDGDLGKLLLEILKVSNNSIRDGLQSLPMCPYRWISLPEIYSLRFIYS